MNYKHSGDFGDLVYFLPTMKYQPGDLYISQSLFTRQALTPENFAPILPLLLSQRYVWSVKEWKGEEAIDCDLWRKNYKDEQLAETQANYLKTPLGYVNNRWLNIQPKKVAKTVVNRTLRYNGKFPIESVDSNAIFVGLEFEHRRYEKEFGKIDYYPTKDLYELAKVISGCEL